MSTNYQPKRYGRDENAQLARQWDAMVAKFKATGELPEGVKSMGTLFAMGKAGDARPQFPVIAEVDGIERAAVLEQLPPAVRWAVDQTYVVVDELNSPQRRAAGALVVVGAPGQADFDTANAIQRFDPFEHTNLVALTPLQGG